LPRPQAHLERRVKILRGVELLNVPGMLAFTTFAATRNPREFSPARAISGTKMLNHSCFENSFFSPEQVIARFDYRR
jgi:hypothetical protein